MSRTETVSFKPTGVRLEHPLRFIRLASHSAFQTHRGSSGTLHDRQGRRHRSGVSNPQGFVWNPSQDHRQRHLRYRFKPTGVRLERDRLPGDDSHRLVSNPQGFVWNAIPQTVRTSVRGFQTHRGSSGTRPNRRPARSVRSRFKPTGVRLERGASRDGSRHHALVSNPQGFVWNLERKDRLDNALGFQTHRGSSGTIRENGSRRDKRSVYAALFPSTPNTRLPPGGSTGSGLEESRFNRVSRMLRAVRHGIRIGLLDLVAVQPF